MGKQLFILGAGPGGYVAAVRAAQLGAEVTLVEESALGGTCLNRGCIPSKIMKTSAEMVERLRKAHDFGIRINENISFDMHALMARKEKVIENQAKGILSLLNHHHIQYINGRGTILSHHLGRVTLPDKRTMDIPWDSLILATGTIPLELPSFPFDGEKIISSDHILSLEEVPDAIAIVGGGVIGCEFAFILNALGAHVTLVEAQSRMLPMSSVDKGCSKVLQREMKKRKIAFITDRCVQGIEERESKLLLSIGPPEFAMDGNADTLKAGLAVDKLLVCIGRKPITEHIGLETVGLETDENGWIIADDRMKTSVSGIYAIGDVLGPSKIMLAHVASAEGSVAAENIMGGNRLMRYDTVPTGIYTMPEVANVGLTEDQAMGLGCPIRTDVFLFRNLGKAQVIDEIAGEIKMISNAESGKILGVHIIGPHATDLIAEGTLAIQAGCSVKDLAGIIHAHPTLSEAMMEVSLKASGNPLHG